MDDDDKKPAWWKRFLSGVGVCVIVIAFSFIECSDSTDDGPGFSIPIYEKIKNWLRIIEPANLLAKGAM